LVESQIVAFLGERGLPVAVPVPCDDGQIVTEDETGYVYALTPRMPLDSSAQASSAAGPLYANVGSTLARMHLALIECPFALASWDVDSDWFAKLWERLEATLPAPEWEEIAGLVRPWRLSIEDALTDPHRQRVHGDVHGANLLTNERTVTGIIDVDHLPIAPRTYDVAYFLAFSIQWPLRQTEPREPVDDDLAVQARQLITGYHSVSPLTSRETTGIPALSLAVAVALLDYFVTEQQTVERSWIETARWIVLHRDLLTGT
jgi:Ser/Thr protein kinase RdoA (MazF antagonist)